MKMTIENFFRTLLAAAFAVSMAATAFAAAPMEIHYQGKLTDSGGVPLPGPRNLTFSFWDSAVGGTQIGSDIAKNGVVAVNGVISVGIDGIPTSTFRDNAVVYLQVRDSALPSPFARQKLTGAPFALSVANDTVGSSEVIDGSLLNVDINAAAGILSSKIDFSGVNPSSIGGTLGVAGNTTLSAALTATGGSIQLGSGVNKVGIGGAPGAENLKVTGTANITGNTAVGGTLGVTGNTTLSGSLSVAGGVTNPSAVITISTGVTLNGSNNLVVGGRLTANDLTIGSGLTLPATVSLTNLSVGGTLDVTGAATLSNTLDVTGNTTVNAGDLRLTGGYLTDTNSVLNISTGVTLSGTNDLIVGGRVTATNLTVSNGITLPASVTATNLDVTGTLSNPSGVLSISTGVTLSGTNDLIVGGRVTANNLSLTNGTVTDSNSVLSISTGVTLSGTNDLIVGGRATANDLTLVNGTVTDSNSVLSISTGVTLSGSNNLVVGGAATVSGGDLRLTSGNLTDTNSVLNISTGVTLSGTNNLVVGGKLTLGGGSPIVKYFVTEDTGDYFGVLNDGTTDKHVFTVPGAAPGDMALVSIVDGSDQGFACFAMVNATDKVAMICRNESGSPYNPPSLTFRIGLIQH